MNLSFLHTLTAISWVILGVLTAWVLAHAIALTRRFLSRSFRVSCEEAADSLNRFLLRQMVATNEPTLSKARRLDGGHGVSRHEDWKREFSKRMNGLRDSHEVFVSALERYLSENNQFCASKVRDVAGLEVKRTWERFIFNLILATLIAPLAGAAPTMSGVMEFLVVFEGSAASGTVQFDGLGDALMTTYEGLTVAMIAYALVMAVSWLRARQQNLLAHELESVLAKYYEQEALWEKSVAVRMGPIEVTPVAMEAES